MGDTHTGMYYLRHLMGITWRTYEGSLPDNVSVSYYPSVDVNADYVAITFITIGPRYLRIYRIRRSTDYSDPSSVLFLGVKVEVFRKSDGESFDYTSSMG